MRLPLMFGLLAAGCVCSACSGGTSSQSNGQTTGGSGSTGFVLSTGGTIVTGGASNAGSTSQTGGAATIGGTSSSSALPPAAAAAFATGDEVTCILTTSGSIRCSGRNVFGGLGDGAILKGSTQYSAWPVAVIGITNAHAIGGSAEQFCAILDGSAVQCWGGNSSGQLGNGGMTDSSVPVTVTGISNATAVATGSYHTCSLLSGGTVQCWGSNIRGQLGSGSSSVQSSAPVPVVGITNATAIDAGANHTCALLIGGTIECWGDSSEGQIGNETISTYTLMPITVTGVTNATAVAAGYQHTCALLSGGSVKCWGSNITGELGNGTTTSSPVPVTVTGITNGTAVTAGGSRDESHSCVLLSGGTIQCWGDNVNGQLGNSTTTNSTVPVTVASISNAAAVSAGSVHTCALLSGGKVRCWGWNDSGELGNGTTTSSSVPIAVKGFE